MNEAEIHAKVRSVFADTELLSIPVKVVSMASYYGFSVFELDMEDHISGMIVANEKPIDKFNTNKVIAVNSNHASTRKRFTVAHELGHYILGGKPESCFAHRDTSVDYDEEEKYANRFAAELLMPEDDVRRFVNSITGGRPDTADFFRLSSQIAERYQVSQSAAEVRLKELSIA